MILNWAAKTWLKLFYLIDLIELWRKISDQLVIAFLNVVALKGALLFLKALSTLCSLSADSAGQLDVLRHDGDSLGVDSAQVCR